MAKEAVSSLPLDHRGAIGDAHAGSWHRQISILSEERIEAFSAEEGRTFLPGEFGENVTTSGLDLACLCPMDRLRCGDVELEITQIGKSCHGDRCSIFKEVGRCVMPSDGVFARVLEPGTLVSGMPITMTPHELRILVITLSDRASVGDYEDRSGPKALGLLKDHFSGTRWHPRYDSVLLADDADALEAVLLDSIRQCLDIVVLTGSTGVGPRDIAPDVVARVADKEIPGIMEMIRVTSGGSNPKALLSRSIAAVSGVTQLYAIPGSPSAVSEYLQEICKTLEHVIMMVHRIDAH